MSVQQMCTGEETLVPAALRGFRTWDLGANGELMSRLPYQWTFATQEAMCLRVPYGSFFVPLPFPLCSEPSCLVCRPPKPEAAERHDAPSAMCECGFYGWYAPHDTRMTQGKVFGAVEVSGRVLLGTHGFRAAQARVLGLAPSDYFVGTTAPLQALQATAERDGVPVYPNVDALLAAFPPDDVSDLVQHTCGPDCDPERGPNIVFSVGGPVWTPTFVAPTPPGSSMKRLMDAVARIMEPRPASAAVEPERPLSAREQALERLRTRGTGPARDPFARRGRAS